MAVLKSYLSHHTRLPCRFPHPALPFLVHHSLFATGYTILISSGLRTTDFQPHKFYHATPPNYYIKRTSSCLCLESSRALLAGVSVDDIVTHGNWSTKHLQQIVCQWKLVVILLSWFWHLRKQSNTLKQQSQKSRNEE
jgi:hypothetical protein